MPTRPTTARARRSLREAADTPTPVGGGSRRARSLPPFSSPIPEANRLWRPTLLLVLLSAGCLDEAPQLTNPLQLEVHNDTSSPTDARLSVYEAYGNTVVYERAFRLGVGERRIFDSVEFLEGSYRLRMQSNGLRRDADVRLEQDAYYRFVILDDIIAFQRLSR